MLGDSQSLFSNAKGCVMRVAVASSSTSALRALALSFNCLPERDVIALGGVEAKILSSLILLVHLLEGPLLLALSVESLVSWSSGKS